MLTRTWNETMEIIAERRESPGDDLISVLVHAEVDGERLTDSEIYMGIGLLGAAGNDSTRAVFTSGMRGLMEDRDQMQLLLDDSVPDPGRSRGAPSLLPGVRPLQAHRDPRRRASRRDDPGGRQGAALVRLEQS